MAPHDVLLAAIRKREWTQRELAWRIEVDESAVSRWCSGAQKPDLENAVALSDLLGIPVSTWT